MNLYQISNDYAMILNELYDEDGNENPQALARLEENEVALQKKAVSLAAWIKNMEAEKDAISEARKQMSAREKALDAKIDRWQEYLKFNMESRGIFEIKCPQFELKLKKNNPSVDAYNEDEVPDEYWVVTKRLDKVKMLSEMKNGVVIPGANIARKMRLEIK